MEEMYLLVKGKSPTLDDTVFFGSLGRCRVCNSVREAIALHREYGIDELDTTVDSADGVRHTEQLATVFKVYYEPVATVVNTYDTIVKEFEK